MRSADEVALMYTFNRANLAARAAIYTLLIINRCEIILNHDSSRRTGFLTLSAGDATVFTILAHLSALVMIITGYCYTGGISYEMNNAVRTFLNAHTATDTFSRINRGKALIIYANRVTGAHLYTVTVTIF